MNNSFYTAKELSQLGIKKVGNNIQISRKVSIYNPENISLGNNVRIDDFCVLSGNITLGSYIHISAYSALYGKFGVEMEDYSGLSPRCTIFSASDDFSGDFMIGPMIDEKFTNVTGGKVTIKKFSQLGCNCIVLPSVTIGIGVSVGALSLVKKNLDEWGIYAGNPLVFIKERKKELLSYYDELTNRK